MKKRLLPALLGVCLITSQLQTLQAQTPSLPGGGQQQPTSTTPASGTVTPSAPVVADPTVIGLPAVGTPVSGL
ncbi:MAG TPA: hypothetical protein VGA96_10785, partial [Fibrella sp.]